MFSNAQVTHSLIWRRMSHGYDPASSVAICISPYISVLHPYSYVHVVVLALCIRIGLRKLSFPGSSVGFDP